MKALGQRYVQHANRAMLRFSSGFPFGQPLGRRLLSKDMMIRILSLLAALGMVAALFAGGAQPAAVGLFAAPWDKLAHAGFFLALTILLLQAWPRPWWLAPLLAVLVGMGDEWHQFYLPGRMAGWIDLVADAVGVALAAGLHEAAKTADRSAQ
ncbi:MAG: VanZ family protein [Candidatus Nitricoxidivorans perseverans]|uniref:VanZ family protein n=1 Tax=Candidatus Nitricoxidivorans perseverans TaxID=2975601 RepID=A0AA49FL93_9PROT|nr:MAG: VanZ family protein [Candidatus Nitricoxidivorans perseverans]